MRDWYTAIQKTGKTETIIADKDGYVITYSANRGHIDYLETLASELGIVLKQYKIPGAVSARVPSKPKTTNFFIKPPNLQIDKFINNFLQKSLSCKYGNTSQGELYHFTEINTILISPQVLIWE